MYFRENNNGRSKWAYKNEHVNAINVFHDVNSILHTATHGNPNARPGFYKSYQCIP